MRSISLLSPTAAVAVAGVAVITTLIALLRPNRRTFLALVGTLLVLAAAVFALCVWPKPFPDSIPWTIYAGGAGAVFVTLSAVLQKGRRLLLAVLAIVALGNTYLITNLTYQQYPTIGSFRPAPVTVNMTLEEFQAAKQAPILNGRTVGALVTLPADPMRDAVAYVPPAYWQRDDLPVLLLLPGDPGAPEDWFTNGAAAETADSYQRRHNGAAPIVISVDATGSETGNPACVDGPELAVQTYLTQTIPSLITRTFTVNTDQSTWTVGGLSYGGTCALQVMTNHPGSYGSFLDFSGEPEPTLGDHQETVDKLFGGDEAAFQAHNPATLLAQAAGTGKYSGVAGRFIAGERDEMSTAALPHLDELARAAGMDTSYSTLPGAHSYGVWRIALRNTFDFAGQRGGLS
nr:alpha/beta hydrolase-fold protein [Corynebacterium capitovis]